MPSLFTENDVAVLRDDLPDTLHAKLRLLRTALARTSAADVPSAADLSDVGTTLSGAARAAQDKAASVNKARRAVLSAFGRGGFGQADKPRALALLGDTTGGLLRHDLDAALAAVRALSAEPPVPGIGLVRATLGRAVTAGELPYRVSRVTKVITLPNGKQKEIRVTERRTLPALETAAIPTAAEIGVLLDAQAMLEPTEERAFRIGLLHAEVLAARDEYAAAVDAYRRLLPAMPAGGTRPDREKFAALRAGFAALAMGDLLFRRSRVPDAAARAAIRAAYDTAAALVSGHDIAPENPLRRHVEDTAAARIAMLDAGQNVLGLREHVVPILRPAALRALAERRLAAAREAVDRFETFKLRADQIQDALRDLDFQQDIKARELEINATQVGKAREQIAIVETQIEQIRAQRESLDTLTLVQLAGHVFSAATAPTGAQGLQSVPGLASTIAGYQARKQDLAFSQAIAERQASLAARDLRIAQIGLRITEATIDFLEDRVRRIQDRELDADLYYAVAGTFRALARRHLDEAVGWAFQFERAVAFLRLAPDLRVIRFDYGDGPQSLLAAPSLLQEDLLRVAEHDVPVTKFQLLTEQFSLRTLFPVEFARFQQTGRMDFALSLYELSKRRPGVFRQRIKRVRVELQFPPPTGFTGRIRHRGSFLLRDRETTPEPGVGRFLPAAAELQAAFDAIGDGAAQGVPIGGVLPCLLDVDTIELGLEQPDDPDDAEPDAFTPIEGYGPAGDWTLEVENVDLRFITDAVLRITSVIPESDEALGARVTGLLRAFEAELLAGDALDLIAPVPLRQRFPDALAQLARGDEARFELTRADFPAGITDLRLKAVLVQLLDGTRKGVAGVALEIAGPAANVRLDRVTGDDGLSEDLTRDLPVLARDARPSVEGPYVIRARDATAVAAVRDATVFLVFEFREA